MFVARLAARADMVGECLACRHGVFGLTLHCAHRGEPEVVQGDASVLERADLQDFIGRFVGFCRCPPVPTFQK